MVLITERANKLKCEVLLPAIETENFTENSSLVVGVTICITHFKTVMVHTVLWMKVCWIKLLNNYNFFSYREPSEIRNLGIHM